MLLCHDVQVFRELLRLGRRFGAAELEAVVVASPGDDGLLPEIHMVRLPAATSQLLMRHTVMSATLDPQEGLSFRVWRPTLQDLLRGMNQRILVDNSNWARHVARRLLEHWREKAIWKFSDPPFLVAKDEDAAVVYSQLSSLARCSFLVALWTASMQTQAVYCGSAVAPSFARDETDTSVRCCKASRSGRTGFLFAIRHGYTVTHTMIRWCLLDICK